MRRWISVSEWLPQQRKVVLLYAEHIGEHPTLGYLAPMNDSQQLTWWSVAFPVLNGSFVTHWMPLPEPPSVSDDPPLIVVYHDA